MSSTAKLLRVVVRGPQISTRASDTFDGVEYLREPGANCAIYLSLRTGGWRQRLRWTRPDDSKMHVTVLQLPFGRGVGVEFCSGSAIDLFVAAAAAAGTDGPACVAALAPLLQYFQQTHTF